MDSKISSDEEEELKSDSFELGQRDQSLVQKSAVITHKSLMEKFVGHAKHLFDVFTGFIKPT